MSDSDDSFWKKAWFLTLVAVGGFVYFVCAIFELLYDWVKGFFNKDES